MVERGGTEILEEVSKSKVKMDFSRSNFLIHLISFARLAVLVSETLNFSLFIYFRRDTNFSSRNAASCHAVKAYALYLLNAAVEIEKFLSVKKGKRTRLKFLRESSRRFFVNCWKNRWMKLRGCFRN